MSQSWYTDVYQIDTKSADTIMGQIEQMLESLKSGFSGVAAPSDLVGGMPWHDSTARKVRNYANTAWLASLLGDAAQKMWVYRNNTCEGWLVDASVADRVLAVKGGANAYNVNGGNLAGTHTQPSHTLTTAEVPSIVIPGYDCSYGDVANFNNLTDQGRFAAGPSSLAGANFNLTISTGGGAHNHGSTHRPAAAVGTLQYPDMS